MNYFFFFPYFIVAALNFSFLFLSSKEFNDRLFGIFQENFNERAFPLLFVPTDVPRESCTDSAALDKVVAFNRTCYDLQLNEGNTFAKARGSCLKQRGDLWNHVSKSAFELIVRELERRKHTMKVRLAVTSFHHLRLLKNFLLYPFLFISVLFLFHNGRLAVTQQHLCTVTRYAP